MELLGMMTLKDQTMPDYTLEEKLAMEEELLGVYLSGHPVQQFSKIRQRKNVQDVAELVSNQPVRVLLYIKNIREIRTKKGEQMAFLDGNDASGDISVTIFPTLYRHIRTNVALSQVLYIEGKAETSSFNGELQILASRIERASQMEESIADKTCYLRISAQEEKDVLPNLAKLLVEYTGNVPVILFFEGSHKKQLLDEKSWIVFTDKSEMALKQLLGDDNVVFR
jgi:DNA polymerase-3 subunit alpha